MEIWVFILTVWAFVHWLQTRSRRQREDERFERVIDALNRGQAKIESLEKQIHELERRVAAGPAAAEKPAPAVAPPAVKPAEIRTPSRIPP